MPLRIINNYGDLSLQDLQQKMRDGYSVMKSPHVGNQHPSNLVCAALKIPFTMVSFTQGIRDKNFHPHLKIKQGVGESIANETDWTPFAKMACGGSVEDFHQSSLKERFPQLSARTDFEIMMSEIALAESTLRSITAAIPRVWYRSVDCDGAVTNYPENPVTKWADIESSVFRFSDFNQGWLIPNRVHILFTLALQALGSGKDSVFHLSGPQMVGYIMGAEKGLSAAYELLRKDWPALPETLTVHIVPAASCRMIVHKDNRDALDVLDGVLRWYEDLPNEERRFAKERFAEVVKTFPEFTVSIESATCLSQYDILSTDDLELSSWMLETPLSRVVGIHTRMLRLAA